MDGCGSTGGGTTALVRPEAVEVVPEPAGAALVLSASFLGPTSRVTVALPDDTLLVAQVPSAQLPELVPGTRVRVRLRPEPVAIMD